MNKQLLRRVRDHILAEPTRLDMNVMLKAVDTKQNGAPPCGTVGCIAGWTVVLEAGVKKLPGTAQEYFDLDVWGDAQEFLGLSNDEAGRLFQEPYVARYSAASGRPHWPLDFAAQYVAAKTPQKRAKITAARIDRFIETNGAE